MTKEMLRITEKNNRIEFKGSLPKGQGSDDTLSLLNREMREYLQKQFLEDVKKIVDRKAERLADFDILENALDGLPIQYLLAFENQELLHCLNLLNKAQNVAILPPDERPTLFVMHESFIRKCAKSVEFSGSEEAVLITGLDLGNVKIPTDFLEFEKDKSVVSIRSLPKMMLPSMQKLDKAGLPFLGAFHSHPGGGIPSPSTTDLETQDELEQLYKPLGGIFTNDGFVTFYSKDMDFRVEIMGKHVKQVRANSWKLG